MSAEPLSDKQIEWVIRRGRTLKVSPEILADILDMPIKEVREIWSRGPVTRHPKTGEPETDFGRE